MKAPCVLTVLVAVTLSIGAAGPVAGQAAVGGLDSVRTMLPSDVSLELLGRAFVYAFSYQRMLTPMVGLEGSFAGLGSGSGALVLGGVGARYYFVKRNASPFVTAGAMLASTATSGSSGSRNASKSYVYTGLGVEFRAPDGLVFRGTVYGMVLGGGHFWVWPGLSMGFAF